MRLKRRKKEIIKTIFAIVIFVSLTYGIYIGLQFFLSTKTPLLAVASGSMRPALDVGDLVFIRGVNAHHIAIGDIIAFYPPDGSSIPRIHRVTNIQYLQDGAILFRTKGDDNEFEEPSGFQIKMSLDMSSLGYHILAT